MKIYQTVARGGMRGPARATFYTQVSIMYKPLIKYDLSHTRLLAPRAAYRALN